MKAYSIILAIICVALVVALLAVKRGDNAQHDADTAAITTFSNQLDDAQLDLSTCRGSLIITSNNLNQCQSAALQFSNHWAETQSAVVMDAEQITNLTRQVAEADAENHTLDRHIASLTNQLATLVQRIASTEASLGETNSALAQIRKDYSLLEDRFRRDVAERVVMERRFNNLGELQAQLKKLQKNPAGAISAEHIYAGLDVVVNADGSFHVISPN